MKQEDYVSFEVAKLLKEKGYNEYCDAYYHNDEGEGYENLTDDERLEGCWKTESFRNERNRYRDAAPSLAQAAKWLREEHHIDIEVMVYSKYGQYYVNIRKYTRLIVTEDITEESYEAALNEGRKEALKFI